MDTLFPLPDDATLYRALTNRDPAYEGRALVGVSTTGIFCRLTCPARKPRPENCRWFDTPGAALAAGFRPCRRCHPLGPEATGDPVISRMLRALEANPFSRGSGRLLEMAPDAEHWNGPRGAATLVIHDVIAGAVRL